MAYSLLPAIQSVGSLLFPPIHSHRLHTETMPRLLCLLLTLTAATAALSPRPRLLHRPTAFLPMALTTTMATLRSSPSSSSSSALPTTPRRRTAPLLAMTAAAASPSSSSSSRLATWLAHQKGGGGAQQQAHHEATNNNTPQQQRKGRRPYSLPTALGLAATTLFFLLATPLPHAVAAAVEKGEHLHLGQRVANSIRSKTGWPDWVILMVRFCFWGGGGVGRGLGLCRLRLYAVWVWSSPST